MSYFNNLYEIDLKTCQYLYTSGRNEFRNKGVDILIESLSQLNNKLKNENSDKTIICFFLIPIGDFPKEPIIEKSVSDFNSNIMDISPKPYFPLSNHIMPKDNEIINHFIKFNLLNKKEDNVKVILIPEYLDDGNNSFNSKYYEVASGMDLSIFPSKYEPWGYTPVESIYFSVATITTNEAGFGRYFSENFSQGLGVEIVDRKKENSYDEQVKELSDYLNSFIFKSIEEKVKLKESSKEISKEFSWNKFYENYVIVYNQVLK
jgi:phosphorylase/glycogen(starch) synthase